MSMSTCSQIFRLRANAMTPAVSACSASNRMRVTLERSRFAALAGIESPSADEGDALLGDLLRAGPEQRRDRPAADVREAHAADVVGRRRRERVEVAVRVEVHEREVGLDRERAGQAAGDERALAAEHRAGGAGA